MVCKNHAVIEIENVVGLEIAVNLFRQRFPMQDIEMIILAERIDSELPVDVGMQDLRARITMTRQIPVFHVVSESSETLVNIDRVAPRWSDPKHPVLLSTWKFD